MRKLILTEEQKRFLIRHYPNTENEELAYRLGCCNATLITKARELGLKKSKKYISQIYSENGHAAIYHFKKLGIKLVSVEKYRFKKGYRPWNATLTDEQKEYIRQHYYDMSNREIAEALGVKMYSVRNFAQRNRLVKSKECIDSHKGVRLHHGKEKD